MNKGPASPIGRNSAFAPSKTNKQEDALALDFAERSLSRLSVYGSADATIARAEMN